MLGSILFIINSLQVIILPTYRLPAIETSLPIKRRLFIENNFNFTETRNNPNKGIALPMKGISSELSDFSSYAEGNSNNKTLEKLLDRLLETIHLYEFNNLNTQKK